MLCCWFTKFYLHINVVRVYEKILIMTIITELKTLYEIEPNQCLEETINILK